MQKINPLLNKASAELKKNSGSSVTVAGQKTPVAGRPTRYDYERQEDRAAASDDAAAGIFEPGHVDAINQIFSEFAFAYHNQYHKAFPDLASVTIAKEYWLSCLANYSPLQITTAGRKLVKSSEFLPTLSAVVKACDSGVSLFGLPSSRQAYLEACCAASPKSAQQWSHEAVYHAGRASDWFVLANESEAVALPIFEYNYRQICQRVMQGEKLSIDVPKALPAEIGKKLSPAQRRERLKKLRQEVGI